MVAMKDSDKLARYRETRKAGSTPEPFRGKGPAGPRFVVQLQPARQRHTHKN
jgi:hypothetical protein